MSVYLPNSFNAFPIELIELISEYAVPAYLSKGKITDRYIKVINTVVSRLWRNYFPYENFAQYRQNYPIIYAWLTKNKYPTTKNIHALFNMTFHLPNIKGVLLQRKADRELKFLIQIHPQYYIEYENERRGRDFWRIRDILLVR